MAYNLFLHSSTEAPFYLMFGGDDFLQTLVDLLPLKFSYKDDEKCRIHLDAMQKIYMVAILNLKNSKA